MVLLGKTYGNLMVDVNVSNRKLQDRAERILIQVLGIGREEAIALLSEAGGSVKNAIAMRLLGLGKAKAVEVLDKHGGSLRKATEIEVAR
jgi:N-acetylmuramic acid 6-phosphate etherase